MAKKKPDIGASLNSELRGRYEKLHKVGVGLEHEGWYGSPVKRPPSRDYRDNYEKIFGHK